MDDAERQLFGQAVRRATETHTGAALDTALAELGWLDALEADPHTAVAVLFDAQGAANVTSSALGQVLRAALGLATGQSAVLLPPLGQWDPPARVEAGLCVNGLGLADLAGADTITVVAEAELGQLAVTVSPRTLHLRTVRGMDPSLGPLVVAGEVPDAADGSTLAPGAWAAAVDHARIALAYELVGASGALLELARDHALERVQFGRPVASFQAVRHRLAETYVAIEGARALTDAAAAQPSTEMAAMAKAVAGRAARQAARHCQQVLAGIGFTTEHPLHHYVKRVLVLDELFGSSRVITRDLGRRLSAGGTLEPPITL